MTASYRPPHPGRRLAAIIAGTTLLLAACTTPSSEGPPQSPSAQPGHGLPATVSVGDTVYRVGCTPVAEALVDVPLPRSGPGPKVRAITGLWDRQAVAVLANDPTRCGVWALGLAEDLDERVVAQIEDEVAHGVDNFGVTASPVPKDDGAG